MTQQQWWLKNIEKVIIFMPKMTPTRVTRFNASRIWTQNRNETNMFTRSQPPTKCNIADVPQPTVDFHRRHHQHHLRNISKQPGSTNLLNLCRFFWFTLIIMWSNSAPVVNGLPLVTSSSKNIRSTDSLNYGMEECGLLCIGLEEALSSQEQRPVPDVQTNQNEEDEDDTDINNGKDAVGSFKTTNDYDDTTTDREVTRTLTAPRKKKGLSYLSKYFSEGLNNNANVNSGTGESSNENLSHYANQFFGVGNRSSGGGRTTNVSSNEQRFPSTIRRKLSFYPPPVASHSTFMTPWSRTVVVGRPTTSMRLRWGK